MYIQSLTETKHTMDILSLTDTKAASHMNSTITRCFTKCKYKLFDKKKKKTVGHTKYHM